MKKFPTIICLFMVCLSACVLKNDENNHFSIPFTNNSDLSIIVFDHGAYPDTIIQNFSELSQPDYYGIAPGATNKWCIFYPYGTWENTFEDYDTIRIFVFDANRVESKKFTPQEAVIARYDITKRDMIVTGWKLTYPPQLIINVKYYNDYGINL